MATSGDSRVETVLEAVGTELMRMARRGSRVYPGSVVDLSAFKILWLLTDSGPLTMKDLAAELQLEQSTVSRQVKAAVERGLIERYDVEGASSRLHRPTAAGSEVYLQEAALRTAVIREALESLGVERATLFVGELAAFNDALDEAYARARAID